MTRAPGISVTWNKVRKDVPWTHLIIAYEPYANAPDDENIPICKYRFWIRPDGSNITAEM